MQESSLGGQFSASAWYKVGKSHQQNEDTERQRRKNREEKREKEKKNQYNISDRVRLRAGKKLAASVADFTAGAAAAVCESEVKSA